MKNTNTNAIVFAQAKDNSKLVTANKYVAHALYTQNKALVESLGGTVLKGVGGFQAEFKTVANAKKFVATAITHIDAEDYAKARKTEPKAKAKAEPKPKKVAPTPTKGKAKAEFITLTDADGNTFKVPTSVLEGVNVAPKKTKGNAKADKPTTAPTPKAKTEKVAPTKAKGNATLTDAQKKALEVAKTSILNRAASAYSIANGGEATTFKALGKTEKDLVAYIPNAKVGMMKSKKWTKAVEMGITEDMLGF